LGGFVVVAFALSSRLHVPLFPALAPHPPLPLSYPPQAHLALFFGFWVAKEFQFQEIFKNILHQGR